MSRMAEQQLYIHGGYTSATSGRTFETINPANGNVLATVQAAGREDVDRAVKSAQQGQKIWAAMTAMERSRILRRAVDILRERNDELLAEFDIPLVHELPGVGENLQDHLEMYLQYECKEPVSLYPALQWWNQPKIGAEWLFGGTGVGASNHFEAGGFIRSREEFAWPNIQYHFLPVAINYNGSNAVKEHGFQCHVGSMRSPSRGHVRIKSRDPHQHPAILFNYMSHEQDWQEFRDAIRITREIMHQPALDQYRGREISPGVECQTDEQLDEFVRNHAETAFHPCGTCKMGYDEMAVVDAEGRVHGLEGLRVVDASIMPQIITGNLNATTIMIGEKMADMIRGKDALPRSTARYFVANGMPVRAKKMSRDVN